jgi:surface polysaccharide O-acyltransferase-like enzyme
MFNLLPKGTMNTLILFFGLGIPLFFLISGYLADLNSNRVYLTWFVIAVILIIVCYATSSNNKFLTQRSARFDVNEGVNRFIADHSTSALKALFFFLVIYWPLNKFHNRKGLYLISTHRKPSWYDDDYKREITGYDVFANIILYFVTMISALVEI